MIDPDHYDPSEEIFSATLSTPAPEAAAAAPAASPAETFYRPQDAEPMWRAEVSSRVNNFRSRRRRPGASAHASMRFDFDAREGASPMASAELRALPRLEPEVGKILAFPKALPEPQAVVIEEPSLAEPRIVEAEVHHGAEEVAAPVTEVALEPEHSIDNPAEYWERPLEPLAGPVEDETLNQVLEADPEIALPQVSPLADIALDPTPAEATDAPTFDLVEDDVAFSIAPLFDRAVAGGIDSFVCSAASAIFLGVFFAMAKPELRGLQLFAFSSVLSCLGWTLYQYIFLVHRGQTLGMQFVQLEVKTFEGEPAWPSERRMRVLGLALSCASLGLGFLWSLIDEDRLGWHDRISRSCLVRKDQD